jgi:hypothetical protein
MHDISYSAALVPVRDDFAAAHTRFWRRLASPGAWWTGSERGLDQSAWVAVATWSPPWHASRPETPPAEQRVRVHDRAERCTRLCRVQPLPRAWTDRDTMQTAMPLLTAATVCMRDRGCPGR